MTKGTRGARVGLFGGTFNPIHLGHLRAAEEVREALSLERVLFIPSAVPPHKQQDERDPIAPATLRLDWVEGAIAAHPFFSTDRIEIDREGPSFLVDTLLEIRERGEEKGATVFIVGQDAFSEMGEWRETERIFELTDLAVMTRPPGRLRDLERKIPAVVRELYEFDDDGRSARHRKAGSRIDLVPITALDISSSQIRRESRAGRSIRYLVPETIREAIETSQCYARARPERRESD